MKQTGIILKIAALFVTGAFIAAGCSSLKEDVEIVNDNQEELAPETEPGRTVTVTSTVGLEPTTKAISALGVKTFAADETIAVFYTNEGGDLVKTTYTFTAGDLIDGGRKAAITVSMTEPKAGAAMKYIYPAAMANADGTVNYSVLDSQDGTLETLAASLDLATYDGTLTGEAALPESVTLSNQLAIGEFTIKNADGSVNITNTIKALEVTDGTNTYTVTPATVFGDGPIYVAMQPVTSDKTISFTATYGSSNNTVSKNVGGKALDRNNMYPVNLRMGRLVDLTTMLETDGNYSYFAAAHGDVLSASNPNVPSCYITVTDGASVSLNGEMYVETDEDQHASIHCLGSANINLAEGSEIFIDAPPYSSYPCIYVPHNDSGIGDEYTLTISGTGNLDVASHGYGACIGGGYDNSTSTPINCGNIVIAGGVTTITFEAGSNYAAGIGSGNEGSCGNIIISGGEVTSLGASYAAGIGSGRYGSCGNITISGGEVVSTGGQGGAGIGTGRAGSCGDILICGGAIGHYDSDTDYWDGGAVGGQSASGIGCGQGDYNNAYATCGRITITGDIRYLYAAKGQSGYFIIGGNKSGFTVCGTVTIDGIELTTQQLSTPQANVAVNAFQSFTSQSDNKYWKLYK